jgi:DNA-binding response OmpR family regulator
VPGKTRELLVARGVVAPGDVDRAEAAAQLAGRTLCDHLLASHAVEEGVLAEVLAERHGLPGVDLSRSTLAREALELVPRAVAESDGILPLSLDGGRLHVAVTPDTDADRTLGEVRFVTGLEVSPYVAVGESLRRAVVPAYQAMESGAPCWRGAEASGPDRLAVALPGAPELPEGDEAIEGVPPEAARTDAPGGSRGADERPPGLGATGRKRILVVDDEPEIRGLLQKALTARGYEVDTAADGAEALGKVHASPPALVLLDAMLPKVHGFEVARRLRSDARTRGVPVVMMTAIYRGWRFAQDAREAYGAEDYIEKPFRLDDLQRRVEAVLESTTSKVPSRGAAAEPMVKVGRELLQAGKLDEAVAALEEALRADAFSVEAHYQLAKALRQRGEHFRAMTAFERAVELRPELFPALRSLASLYVEKGFRRKAVEVLERALAVAPDPASRDAVRSDLLELLEA